MDSPYQTSSARIVRVGIIGCGEVSQVAHIPNLLFLSDLFSITYLCDVSEGALAHCRTKIPNVNLSITKKAAELCQSPNVDVVFVASSDPYHVEHILTGLMYGKFVFVEKPMALSLRDVDVILEAERDSSGRVMVGYMRRYAAAFMDAIGEIGGLGEILYARVRDIVGQNSTFVAQSGTFPKKFSDYSMEESNDLKSRTTSMLEQALSCELGIPVSPSTTAMWRNLGSLGSHDLSAMREALGMPLKVLGASLCSESCPPFWSALFQYSGFTVSYESGIDHVPRFDASIEIFGKFKTIKICYDTPYVKGLPTTMEIKELGPSGEYIHSTVRRTYEDPYTLEMKELYAAVVDGKAIKTTAEDARKEVEIFQMIMTAGAERT